MEGIFLCVLSMSLTGAVTGLVLQLLHPLTKKWFSGRWNYYIWFLVIARLLLPVHFEMAEGLRLPKPVTEMAHTLWSATGAEGESAVKPEAAAMDSVMPVWETDSSDLTAPEPVRADDGQMMKDTGGTVSYGKSSFFAFFTGGINWLFLAGIVWFAGAVIAFLIKVVNYRRFAVSIRKDSREITDTGVLAVIRETAQRLSMKRAPVVCESEGVSGPVTLGLYPARVILPIECTEENNLQQLSLVIHHEFIHVKRKDLWYKWLYQMLLCLHWFNPVLYLVERHINIDCELACDEAVLGQLTAEGKKAYGNILINAAERNVCFKRYILSTTLLERSGDLKERLTGILHYKKQGKAKVLLSLCMAAGLLYLSACGSVSVSENAMPISLSPGAVADSAESSGDGSENPEEGVGGAYVSSDENEDGTFLTSLFDRLGFHMYGTHASDYDIDVFLSEGGDGNEKSAAWKMYEDDGMIAGEDDHDQWRAYRYKGGGNDIIAKGFVLNGSQTILIVESPGEKKIKMASSYELKTGKFKIVHVKPDGSVALITDSGEEEKFEITLEKGRNAIKMVGQGAKLKELAVGFPGIKERDFDAVYGSEEQEYSVKVLEEVKAGNLDKEKVFQSLPYMESEQVSRVLSAMLEKGVALTGEELCNMLIFSDSKLSGEYLVEAAGKGNFQPDNEVIADMMPYLPDGCHGELLKAVGKKLEWETICGCLPYLDDEEIKEVLVAYMENGNVITYSQYTEIMPFISSRTAEELDRYMEQKQ